MKSIAVIPARGGSKRLPKKNIMLLNGVPLIAYSIKYALKQTFIDEVYVSTDCLEIKNIALEYGALVIDRPKHLSGDFEPTVTAIKNVIDTIDVPIENIILLQATNPLRPENLLKEAYQTYLDNQCDSLFTVSKNEHKLGRITHNIFVPYNYTLGQRSQDLDPLYYENGLLYITKATEIMSMNIITPTAYPYVVNHIFAKVDIDHADDFDYASYLIKKHKYTL